MTRLNFCPHCDYATTDFRAYAQHIATHLGVPSTTQEIAHAQGRMDGQDLRE